MNGHKFKVGSNLLYLGNYDHFKRSKDIKIVKLFKKGYSLQVRYFDNSIAVYAPYREFVEGNFVKKDKVTIILYGE